MTDRPTRSTAVERFQPPNPTGTSLELAPEAWKLATRVADTQFVPKDLRGKPEAVLACILAGHEAGISPMQALAKIHVVDGRPAMAAELMRALVLRAGHEIWTEETTSTRAIVCGSRYGSERVSKVTWTTDDARRANLLGKNNWKGYPRAMLIARATTELCRTVFPDVLAGISHSVEELSDGDAIDVGILDLGPPEVSDSAETPVAAVTAQANRPATAARAPLSGEMHPADPPRRGEIPALPGDEHTAPDPDDDDVVDGEIVEDVDPWPDDDDPPPPDAGPRMTGPQIIAIKLGEHGIHDRTQRLAVVAEIVGHPIESSKDLTADEARQVIVYLDDLPEGIELLPVVAPADEPAPAPRSSSVTPPEEWTGDRWREFMKGRKVKVAQVLREAQRLAADLDPPPVVGMLDDLAGSGICSDLVGWIEDQDGTP